MAEEEGVEDKLERPQPKGPQGWESLYRARGDDVAVERPTFTGDVFRVDEHADGNSGLIQLVQHPCALRLDGIHLLPALIAVSVEYRANAQDLGWSGNYKMMPLPALSPEAPDGIPHAVALFDSPLVVTPEQLASGERVACLSPVGVNLLLQRWVHHNSRVVVPTHKYQDATGGPFEEADILEEWCEDQEDLVFASQEAMEWLREDIGDGLRRQDRLRDPQQRSPVRVEMRVYLKATRS